MLKYSAVVLWGAFVYLFQNTTPETRWNTESSFLFTNFVFAGLLISLALKYVESDFINWAADWHEKYRKILSEWFVLSLIGVVFVVIAWPSDDDQFKFLVFAVLGGSVFLVHFSRWNVTEEMLQDQQYKKEKEAFHQLIQNKLREFDAQKRAERKQAMEEAEEFNEGKLREEFDDGEADEERKWWQEQAEQQRQADRKDAIDRANLERWIENEEATFEAGIRRDQERAERSRRRELEQASRCGCYNCRIHLESLKTDYEMEVAREKTQAAEHLRQFKRNKETYRANWLQSQQHQRQQQLQERQQKLQQRLEQRTLSAEEIAERKEARIRKMKQEAEQERLRQKRQEEDAVWLKQLEEERIEEERLQQIQKQENEKRRKEHEKWQRFVSLEEKESQARKKLVRWERDCFEILSDDIKRGRQKVEGKIKEKQQTSRKEQKDEERFELKKHVQLEDEETQERRNLILLYRDGLLKFRDEKEKERRIVEEKEKQRKEQIQLLKQQQQTQRLAAQELERKKREVEAELRRQRSDAEKRQREEEKRRLEEETKQKQQMKFSSSTTISRNSNDDDNNQPVSEHEKSILTLINLFSVSRAKAIETLEECGGNVQKAGDLLLEEDDE
jgi:hypothetical protein